MNPAQREQTERKLCVEIVYLGHILEKVKRLLPESLQSNLDPVLTQWRQIQLAVAAGYKYLGQLGAVPVLRSPLSDHLEKDGHRIYCILKALPETEEIAAAVAFFAELIKRLREKEASLPLLKADLYVVIELVPRTRQLIIRIGLTENEPSRLTACVLPEEKDWQEYIGRVAEGLLPLLAS